jgi:protein involved in polysaccharide export with SLBB domain
VDARVPELRVVPTPIVVRTLVSAGAMLLAQAAGACTPPRAPAPRPEQQAQAQGLSGVRGSTRRQLEARAAALARQPGRAAEAAQIRARLRDGDFQVGDMVVLNVVGVAQYSDTFQVRSGRVLQLPELPPISLAGVLRSELQPHLQRQLGRYIINPTIDAYSLVRVAVAGGVARPGFYEVRPDAPITDAVMYAGGLSPLGDATKMSVRRAGRTMIPESALRTQIAIGATLDDLNVRPGDELRVGERRRTNWLETARTLAYVAALATGIWATGRF